MLVYVCVSSSSLPSELQLSLQKTCSKPVCFCVRSAQNYDMKLYSVTGFTVVIHDAEPLHFLCRV